MERQEFCEGLKHYFKIYQPLPFLCKAMFLFGKTSIDIVLFDEWLHKKIGNYEEEKGQSMAEAIEENFGAEARTFIKRCISE